MCIRDRAWEHTLVPAEELTDAQKQFILDRFFDTNRRIVARFPRYQELLDLRDNSDAPLTAYSADDFRDLQLLFNLAWTDPDWLAEEPLASLVEKGEGLFLIHISSSWPRAPTPCAGCPRGWPSCF